MAKTIGFKPVKADKPNNGGNKPNGNKPNSGENKPAESGK